MASIFYNEFFDALMTKLINVESDTIKAELRTSSYTPNKDHNHAGLSAEVANGNGYTTGGATLANVTSTQDNTNDRGTMDADDVQWTSSSFTARYATLYDTTATKLICCIDFGGDVTVSSGTFTIQWNTAGILYLN
jgi:hypothetical protein